jgi:hypothetical protein
MAPMDGAIIGWIAREVKGGYSRVVIHFDSKSALSVPKNA